MLNIATTIIKAVTPNVRFILFICKFTNERINYAETLSLEQKVISFSKI